MLFCVLLCLIVIAFVLAGLDKLHESDELAPYDTAAYLQQARLINETGGPLVLLARCFSGTYGHANRMPLYIVLLSLLPFGTLKVLAWAKLFTLVLGGAGIVVLFFVARALFGRTVAALASAAMALNTAYLSHSTMVACEVMLAVWVTLAWFFITRLLQGRRVGFWVGLMLGLGYMTKGTGLFILPVAIGAAIYKERRRVLCSRQLWVALLVMTVVSSPILVRNVRRYGSPFYNVNQSFIWTNSPDDLYSPDPTVSKPTALSYWQTHSAGQMGGRIVRGAFQEGVFTVVALGQTYLLNERLRLKAWPVGLLTLLLAAAAAIRKDARPAALTAAVIFGIFFGFFTWYPAKDIRFLVPLVPIILILAAAGAHVLFGKLIAARQQRIAVTPEKVLIGLCIVLVSGTIAFAVSRPNLRKNPAQCFTTPPGYHELLLWLCENATREGRCTLGPSHAYAYFWTPELDDKLVPVPWVRSIAEMRRVIGEKMSPYLVIDYSTLRNRERCFKGWVELEGNRLRLKAIPPGWRVALSLSEPPAVIAFETTSDIPTEKPEFTDE